MPNSLCRTCRLIDADLFSPAFDNPVSMERPMSMHLPLKCIERSARAGCPLCTCLIASADSSFLPNTVLEGTPVRLSRAIIDPMHAIIMSVGGDDVSHTYFSRIPSHLWALPGAELGRPCRDLELMSFWVEDCVRNHPQCAGSSADPFLPTRLLDLEAFEQSRDLKLVALGAKNVTVKYVALSHCWGKDSKPRSTTTTKTLAQHLQRITFLGLPPTFRDAVELTLRLGQRYLWIDSLCIVQNDTEDWALEASKMASVYGNALVTLSALSSVDSWSGCRVSNQVTMQDCRFFDFDSGPYRIRLFEQEIRKWYEEYGDDTYRRGQYGKNPLRTRAWALQERELSTRNIHFSENLVLWECGTLKASSEMPWDSLKPMDDFQPWPVRAFIDESVSCDGPLSVRDRWYELMEDYMARNLTKEQDKLPALSGLAQSFQRRMPSNRYLAGLWFDHLPRALLWRTGLPYEGSNAHRPTLWRAPSWSFLSVDGYMRYESQRLFNGGGSRPEETPEDYCPTGLDVLDFNIHFTGPDIYGAISEAELLLRGKIVQLGIKHQRTKDCKDHRTSADPWEELVTTSGSIAGAIYFDVRNDSISCTQVWCLPVCPDPYYSVVANPYEKRSSGNIDQTVATVMGLALQKTDEVSNAFRRVGMFRWTEKSLFCDIPVTDLKLI